MREDIVVKYLDNAQMAISPTRAAAVRDTVLRADDIRARALETALAG